MFHSHSLCDVAFTGGIIYLVLLNVWTEQHGLNYSTIFPEGEREMLWTFSSIYNTPSKRT